MIWPTMNRNLRERFKSRDPHIVNYNKIIGQLWLNKKKVKVSYYVLLWERGPSSVALPEVSSIFPSLKGFQRSLNLNQVSKDRRYAVQTVKLLEASL